MQFDLFHSLGRVDSVSPVTNDTQTFRSFFSQVQIAESLGFNTIWVAESHFSSEVQKQNLEAVIPHYQGELGLNCDFGQLAQAIFQRTEKINFGTAIHNIVGGNGGPISSADRVRSLCFYNQLLESPRHLHIGVAAGRFPYINRPFGIRPRNASEAELWSQYKRVIFLEAYEIFVRLLRGEILASSDTRTYEFDATFFLDGAQYEDVLQRLSTEELKYEKRWQFESLKLVPDMPGAWNQDMTLVLGSHDPKARELAFELGSPDVFNLSFTPPEQLAAIHSELFAKCEKSERRWHRSRLPRTVLVFIDHDERRARQRAERCFDTYIEAMKGTVKMPAREALMERALIGTPQKICEDIQNTEKNGFHPDDRIMTWFEFNQKDNSEICRQMSLFSEQVMGNFA